MDDPLEKIHEQSLRNDLFWGSIRELEVSDSELGSESVESVEAWREIATMALPQPAEMDDLFEASTHVPAKSEGLLDESTTN